MAKRLQLILVLVVLLLLPAPARAEEFVACWTHKEWGRLFGRYVDVSRCRLAGGGIADFASDADIPADLYPMLGTVNGTVCWFYTSRPDFTWEIVFVYPNGDADIRLRNPAGPNTPVGIFSRCSAEPADLDLRRAAWERVMSYLHPPPDPDLDPRPGLGVTGMETRLTVPVPEPFQDFLFEAGLMLEVDIQVGDVVVHWGDGRITRHPASLMASGEPAVHRYERKDPGTKVTIAYVWRVRWRPNAGTWYTLDVPDTLTTVDYPVNEIVSVLG